MTEGDNFVGLVVGGTRGIGLAIAERLARPGADIFLNFNSNEAAANSAAEKVKARGATPHLIKQDIQTPEGCAKVIAEVARKKRHLDAIVHSAAVPNPGWLIEQDVAEIFQAINVSGMALLYFTKAAADLMKPGSSVVYLSGVAVDIVLPSHGALGIAKALGECLIRYLSIECSSRKITFNTVRLGPVETELYRTATANIGSPSPLKTPMGRALEPGDVAEVVEFLTSQRAGMITGQTIMIDGGLNTTLRKQ